LHRHFAAEVKRFDETANGNSKNFWVRGLKGHRIAANSERFSNRVEREKVQPHFPNETHPTKSSYFQPGK
jgi:hypothetical protein